MMKRRLRDNRVGDMNSVDTGQQSKYTVKSWSTGERPPRPDPARRRRRSVSLPRMKSAALLGGKKEDDVPVTATLSAVSDIEKLAQRSGAHSEDDKFRVYPDFAYPNTRLNREELRVEMNLPSAYYHNLRQPSKTDDEIGLFYLEILQCFGLPRFEYFKEPSSFAVAVCGAQAFKTDVMPPLNNPMWLSKMRRACTFPIYYAYQTCHIGVFSQSGASAEDGFFGRIGLRISQFRPGSTYDVTLPLRLSTQVYARQQRGSIRVRFHLHYHVEGAAVWSYIPSRIPKIQPNESVVVNCTDSKSFQNVARTVHGVDMQSKFSMSLVKAVSREVQFQQIHILRYLPKREMHNLRTWKYPIISAFVFFGWMHAVYYGSIRYLPGHLVTYLLLHMWKNYGIYCLDGKYDNGFIAPTFEELLCAMFKGTTDRDKDKRQKDGKKKELQRKKQCIEPVSMERTDPDFNKNALQDLQNDEQEKPATLEETAKYFRHRLPTSSRMHWLKVYQNTFVGADAVTFLVQEGFAKSRKEAVHLGRKLAKKFKLFQHLAKKHEFEDDIFLYYRFLTLDDSDYEIKTHKPFAKGLFRALNFRADPTLAREHAHIEFPFASAEDHPRFKVKDSLILRSKESRALMEKMQAEKEVKEAVNAFGVERHVKKTIGDKGSNSDKKRDKKSKKKDSKQSQLVERRSEQEDDSLTDPTSTTEFKTNSLDPTVMIERRNSEDSLVALMEKENDPRYEIKIFPKPPNQDLTQKSRGGDKTMAEVLVATRHKMHQYAGHVFNDRAFKLDMPKVGLGKNYDGHASFSNRPPDEVRKTFFRRTSMDNVNGNQEKEKEEQLYLSARKDEYDRLLHLGRYAHPNPFVSKIAEFVQPMLEMMQIGVFMNRALFNVFTWRDPILSFWVVVIGTMLVVSLHCFPWRIFFGTLGVFLLGPHNWAIRIAKEYAGGYKEPNFDMRIKKKKPKEEEEIAPDEPLFSNIAPDNRIIHPGILDGSNIRPVAVPVGPLMYNRFYDWPPEPEYARVKSENIPQNDAETAGHLESLDFDPDDYTGITRNAMVKPLTRWMRARKMGGKAMKGVKKRVKKVSEEAGAGVKVFKEAGMKWPKRDSPKKVSFE